MTWQQHSEGGAFGQEQAAEHDQQQTAPHRPSLSRCGAARHREGEEFRVL
jgi:hypothetical protein